jgi:hypothetical protein
VRRERGFTSRNGISDRIEFCPVMRILREYRLIFLYSEKRWCMYGCMMYERKQRRSRQNDSKRPPKAPSAIIYHPQLFSHLLDKYANGGIITHLVPLVPHNRRDVVSAIGCPAKFEVPFGSRIRNACDLFPVTHNPDALHAHDHML